MDFVVVIMGWISILITIENVSAIRVIRILRPLRTINSMPGMRNLVTSLLASLPTLFDIMILFMFVLVMFGTIATQLFGGALRGRCALDTDLSILEETILGDNILCPIPEMTEDVVVNPCGLEYICTNTGNPNYGVTSFDNIGVSLLNIFIIITLEGWTDVMYMIRQSQDTYFYDVFFVLTVVMGTFFVLNLMIAVQFSYLQSTLTDSKKDE